MIRPMTDCEGGTHRGVMSPIQTRLASGLALIFDMDGVLVDSMPIHLEAWQKYLESIGINGADIVTRMHGRRNDEIILDFLGGSADPISVLEHGAAKERLYRNMMRERLHNHLVPGIVDFLESAARVPMAVASNAERANIDFVLDEAGLRKYFQVIVDGSQVVSAKPAPDVYLRAARELGVAPRNCVVFEDSPVGVAAARAAGARVAGILTHSARLDHVDVSVADFLDPELSVWLAAQRPE
jgi:beta-phosphoglucomutase